MVETATEELGIGLRWQGEGQDEIGTIDDLTQFKIQNSKLKINDVVVRIDPRYFRPAEVETLLGDPTKAKQKLGWQAKTSFEEMVSEMVRADLESARKDELVKEHGFQTFDYHE